MVSRVVSLVLPNARLTGALPPDLGRVEHLQHLDLAGNALNGTLPATLLNAPELRVLSPPCRSPHLAALHGRPGIRRLSVPGNPCR